MERENILEIAEQINDLPQMIHNKELGGYVYPEEYIGKIVYCINDRKYYYFKDGKTVSVIDEGMLAIITPIVENTVLSKFENLDDHDDINNIYQQLNDLSEKIDSKLKVLEESILAANKNKDKLANDIKKEILQKILDVVDDRVTELSDEIFGKLDTMKSFASESTDGSQGGNLTITKIVMLTEAGFKPKDITALAPFIK